MTLVAAGLAAAALGCGSTPVRPLRPEYDLRSSDPALRMRSVAYVAAQRDTSHVPTLVFLLDDDDAAVRAAAGQALVRMTGHDTGYRPYDPPEERRRHQEAWRSWWAERARSGAPVPSPAPVPPRTP